MTYILVAEEDPHIRLLIQRKLELSGYKVRSTPDGDIALRMALENPPRLLLLDVMLPGQNRIGDLSTGQGEIRRSGSQSNYCLGARTTSRC